MRTISNAISLPPAKALKWLRRISPLAKGESAKPSPALGSTPALAPAPSATAGGDFALVSASVKKPSDTVVLTGKAPTKFKTIKVEWPDGSKTTSTPTRTSDYWTITSDSTQPNGTIKVAITDGTTTIPLECRFTEGAPAAPSDLRVEDDPQGLAVISGRCTADAIEVEVTWPHCLGTALVIPDAEHRFRTVAPRRTIEGVVTVRARGQDGQWGILSSIPYPAALAPKPPWDIRVDDKAGGLLVSGKADAGLVEVLLPDESAQTISCSGGTFSNTFQAQHSGTLRLTAIDAATGYRSVARDIEYVDVRPTSEANFHNKASSGSTATDAPETSTTTTLASGAATPAAPVVFWVSAEAEDLKITVTFVDGRVESKLGQTKVRSIRRYAAKFQIEKPQAGLITAIVEDASGNLSPPAQLRVTI